MKHPGDPGWGAQNGAAGQYLRQQKATQQPSAYVRSLHRRSQSPPQFAHRPRPDYWRGRALPPSSHADDDLWSDGAVAAAVLTAIALLTALIVAIILVAF